MTPRAPQIRKLNSLRGFAALVVVVAHFSGITGWLGGYPGRGAGQLGVMLFFVLSGFLMGYLYIGQELDGTNLRRYLVARFARVVPLFALVLGLSILSPRVGFPGLLYNLQRPEEIASHLLLLDGKSVLWTIPTELHFYALFVVIWFMLRRFAPARFVFLSGIVVAIACLLYTSDAADE